MTHSPPATSEKTLRARDDAARKVIRTELDQNIMVLAGAGAGKTYEMIWRMVNLVRRGTSPRSMAAITFTRKAAGEMRERFFKGIREAREEAAGAEARHLEAAMEEVDQCFIGTIHSFCGRILRERALEAGLPPDFSTLDEREERELQRQVWQQYVRSRDEEELDALEEVGLSPADLYDFFGEACNYPDLNLHAPEVDRPDFSDAVDALCRFVDRHAPHVPPTPVHDKGYDGVQKALRWSRRFLELEDLGSPAQRAAFLKNFLGVGSRKVEDDGVSWRVDITYNRWGSRGSETYELAQELKKERIPELLEHELHRPVQQWKHHAYCRAARFVQPAVEQYAAVRRREGKLTFGDLLHFTRDLLRDHPQVRAFFQRRYHHLFVDEFQDTDPIQAELLFYLTDEQNRDETDWTQLRPRPGSLFLVGDGKQSIYRFRRADYETFNLVKQRFRETGQIVELQRSFRTYENLCHWVNQAFPPIFERHGEPYQAPFKDLLYVQHQADPHEHERLRKLTIDYKYRHNAGQIARDDAARIAAFIAALVRGDEALRAEYVETGLLPEDIGYGDFMILTRTKKRLNTYAEALEQADVPYDVTGAESLGDLDELAALVPLLQSVRRPHNPVPLIAFLRGPFCGMSDEMIYRYRQAGGQLDFRAEPPQDLPHDLRERFRLAFEDLQKARHLLQTLPPSTALERIFEQLGLQEYALEKSLGSSRVGGLLKILAIARTVEEKGGGWIDVLDDLSDLRQSDAYSKEGLTVEAVSAEDPQAVRVMNLHKSKGLQAKVVFLADPYSSHSGNHGPDSHVSRTGENGSFVALPIRKNHGFGSTITHQPRGWQEMEAEEAEFLAAEESRLLYVAATRASHLLVCSQYRDKKDKLKNGCWGPLNPGFEDAEELTAPPLTEVDKPSPIVEMDEVNARRKDLRERLKAPSFKEQTVTDEKDEQLDLELDDGHGRGRHYGTLVHLGLEALIDQRIDLEKAPLYLRGKAREKEIDERFVEPAAEALRRFDASELAEALRHARQQGRPVLTEVSFRRQVADGDEQQVQSGQVDLAYRDAEGAWHLVDFKTGGAGPQRQKLYTDQLEQYRAAWEALSGEPVAHTSIFYVDSEKWVEV